MKRGLSLVEVLVVAAIVSVVAGISFAVIARVRATAKASACVANLTQIGKAVELYRSDYDQFLPPVTLSHDLMKRHSDELNTIKYKQIVGKYGLTESQWFCPLDSITSPAAAKRGTSLRPLLGSHSRGRIFSSYQSPSLLMFMADQKTGLFDINQIPNPSEFIHVVDASTELIIHQPYNYTITAHGHACTTLFMDGHVKLRTFKPYEQPQ